MSANSVLLFKDVVTLGNVSYNLSYIVKFAGQAARSM